MTVEEPRPSSLTAAPTSRGRPGFLVLPDVVDEPEIPPPPTSAQQAAAATSGGGTPSLVLSDSMQQRMALLAHAR